MGENSKIEWCHHTFNPWWGCTEVSAACDFCYARTWAKRFGKGDLWKGERQIASPETWKAPIKWNAAARDAGVRKRVFCASMADVFDNQALGEWRKELFRTIRQTPNLDWLLLTKRPQNIHKMLYAAIGTADLRSWKNVWVGTTTENQEEYDRRYEHLSRIEANVRFISYEPALGPLSILRRQPLPNWVIAGGESGPKARPSDPRWFYELRDECAGLGVNFFMKQMTERGKKVVIPGELLVREWPNA